MRNRLMIIIVIIIIIIIIVVIIIIILTHLFLLNALLQVHFCVSFLLVRARKLSAARITLEWLLARMRADVRCQVIRSRERAHTDPTLERLLARVNANVAGEFVGSRKAAITIFDWTGVRSLMNGRLTWTIRILSWFHGD
jgi:hypothetical protein